MTDPAELTDMTVVGELRGHLRGAADVTDGRELTDAVACGAGRSGFGRRAVVRAAAAAVAGPVVTTAAYGSGTAYAADRGPALHVMTFNLRYASDIRPHSWAERR